MDRNEGEKKLIDIDKEVENYFGENLLQKDEQTIEANSIQFITKFDSYLSKDEIAELLAKLNHSLVNSFETTNKELDESITEILQKTNTQEVQFACKDFHDQKLKFLNLYEEYKKLNKELLEMTKQKIKDSQTLKEISLHEDKIMLERQNLLENMTSNINIQLELNFKLKGVNESLMQEREDYLMKLKKDVSLILEKGEKKIIYEMPDNLKNINQKLDKTIAFNLSELDELSKNVQNEITMKLEENKLKIDDESNSVNEEQNKKINELLSRLKELTVEKEKKDKGFNELKEKVNRANYELKLKEYAFGPEMAAYTKKQIIQLICLVSVLVVLIVYYYFNN